MSQARTLDATALLMVRRDDLIQEAKALLQEVDDDLEAVKNRTHSKKIKANQLKKLADQVQQCINAEMEATVLANQQAIKDYQVKSYSELSQQQEDNTP